ncbi:NAD(+) synthase [Chloroflexota bacterium]
MNPEQIADRLISWIKEQVAISGCKGVALGMSGGIDSSVVAVLCRRAFSQNTLGVIMHCYSNPQDSEHALAVAEKFSIPTRTVVLDTVFDTFLKMLSSGAPDCGTSRLAESNLKARLRMTTLYYHANKLHYVVVGSGNRSELSTGYFTKYGDGGVDILPIGNLVKREVRELAGYLGVPQAIIDKPPSAGLWPGQTDEAELGFSYEELDCYLVSGEACDEFRERVDAMVAACQHKCQPPPIADV